jgi:hypothetical protein
MRNHDLRMRLHPRLYSPGLPLPEDHVTLSVPAANPFPVWREPDLARVPRDRVPSESLVPCLTEIVRAVDKDLVIQRLSRQVFLCNDNNNHQFHRNAVRRKSCQANVMGRTAWMKGHSGHRVHIWLGDVFDRDRDVEIPSANSLVIRSCNKPPILVHESDGVDRPQVLIVLLRDLACPYVVLEEEKKEKKETTTVNTSRE